MIYPVFVYGTLKQGEMNHLPLMRHADFLGFTNTLKPIFQLVSFGLYPAMIDGNRHVAGEFYHVDQAIMDEIDILEGNGSFYNRELIATTFGEAWGYKISPLCYKPEHVIRDGISYDPMTNIESWSSNKRW